MEKKFAEAKKEAKAIALEVAAGTKTPEQAKIELQVVEDSLQDVKLAPSGESKVAVQAALDVLRSAVNSAAKVAIF